MEHTIIWLDDDKQFIENAIPSFLDFGFGVIPCSTVTDAIRELMSGKSQSLLLDISLPGDEKEGLAFLKEVTKLVPGIRVILYTGYPDLSDAVDSIRDWHAVDYISKGSMTADGAYEIFFKKLRTGFIEGRKKVENPWAVKLEKIRLSLEQNDIHRFVELLTSVFAKLAYNIKTLESYYHALVIVILDIAGMKVDAEVETNQGRIDSVMETWQYIYLVEFKLSEGLIALDQIKEHKYFERYLSYPQKKILVGISFDPKTKNIRDYQTEELL